MKKFLKISIVLVLLISVWATIANALSFTATMTPSSTTVAESTEFIVEVKVSNLDVGQGLSSLNGYIRYDTSVFEPITDSSIVGRNSWSVTYTPDNQKIMLTKTTFVKSEESVFQIVFKTKSGVAGKTGEIKFTNIIGANSDLDINAADISTTITVGTTNTNEANTNTNTNSTMLIPIPANNTNTNTNNTNVNTNNTNTNRINTNINTNNTNNTNTNTNTNTDSIPHTGVEDTMLYVCMAVVVLAIVFYVKFERINKEIK